MVMARFPLLPLWEKVSPKATNEGGSRENQRLTPLEHPSSVSAARADLPSPTRGEGRSARPKAEPATAGRRSSGASAEGPPRQRRNSP